MIDKEDNIELENIPEETIKIYKKYFGSEYPNYALGCFYYVIGNYEKALEFYLKSEYQDAWTNYRIADIYKSLKQYDKAIEYFKKSPQFEWTYFQLGEIYEILGEKDNAIENYKLCLKHNSKNQWAKDRIKNLKGKL